MESAKTIKTKKIGQGHYEVIREDGKTFEISHNEMALTDERWGLFLEGECVDGFKTMKEAKQAASKCQW
jgi:hypothetical protein